MKYFQLAAAQMKQTLTTLGDYDGPEDSDDPVDPDDSGDSSFKCLLEPDVQHTDHIFMQYP